MAKRYFRNGVPISDSEALDAHGVVRSGVSLRVAMRFADQRSVFGNKRAVIKDQLGNHVDAASGGRPGFRILVGDAGAEAQRRYAEAQRQYITDLENAWRGDARKAKARPDEDEDEDEDDQNEDDDDDEDEDQTSDAAAKPLGAYPYVAAREGTACTINGGPGVLVRQGNWLVCQPEQRASDRRSVEQMMNDHQRAMDKLYAQRDRELAQAYKSGG